MDIDLMDDGDQSVTLVRRLSLAIGLQYNVILLLGAVCFSLAMASPRLVEVGAACEVLWLLLALVFSGIARWIKRHNQRADAANDEASGANREHLDPSYRHRGSVLRHLIERIRQAGRSSARVSGSDLRAAMSRLETIRQTFLRFAGTHQRLSQFLDGLQGPSIDTEIARVNDALSIEKDPTVKMGLRQALLLSQRRLHQREQVANTLRGIELQMTTIEGAFAHIASIAASASSGRDLESEIDALVARTSPPDVLDAEVGAVLVGATAGVPSMRSVTS